MKNKIIVNKDGQLYECTVIPHQPKKKKGSVKRTVCKILDAAEIIASTLAQINRIIKHYEKINQKRLEKFGKVDKKTGMLVLDRCKPLARASAVKRRKIGD